MLSRDLPYLRPGLLAVAAGLSFALLLLDALIRAWLPPRQAIAGLAFGVALLAMGGAVTGVRAAPAGAPGRRLPWFGAGLLYFTPFLLWFSQKPSVYYLAINVFLMQLCLTGWLVAFQEQLAQWAAAAGDRAFRLETTLAAWGTLILHTFLTVFVLAQVISHELEIGGLRFPALFLAPWKPVFIVPCALAVLNALRALLRCPGWAAVGDPRAD